MKRLVHVIVLSLMSLSLLAVSGCQEKMSTTVEHEAELSAKLGLTLDPALAQDERRAVVADLYRAQSLDIHVTPGSYFTKIFGSPDNEGVMRYLSERVHYVISKSVKLDSRLSHFDAQADMRARASLISERSAAFQIYTMAVNVGTMLWFESLADPSKPLNFQVGQTLVPITSSRIGLIQLGGGYTTKNANPTVSSQMLRIATFVHEARHSDCTGGITSSDLQRLQMGDDPMKANCGHLHVRCPEGHRYDGAYACDDEPWGAYSVQATYLGGIIKFCKNCTEEEKTVATTIFADSLDRVIPMKDMLAGKLGDPDMSTSTEVRPSPEDEVSSSYLRFR